ncbi:MAG: TIGR02466 family protein [Betaproteobacteria bacterium]
MNNIDWLFSTPIAEYDLSEYLTDEVMEYFLTAEADFETYEDPGSNTLVEGIRAWSTFEDSQNDPRIYPLFEKFQECVDEYSRNIGLKPTKIFDAWVNYLTQDGAVDCHRHYSGVVSAAFYPYAPEGSSDITFISPLEGFMMNSMHLSDNDAGIGKYTSNIRHYSAQTGKLVLFPSWLQHYVSPNKCPLRITLSFNTK